MAAKASLERPISRRKTGRNLREGSEKERNSIAQPLKKSIRDFIDIPADWYTRMDFHRRPNGGGRGGRMREERREREETRRCNTRLHIYNAKPRKYRTSGVSLIESTWINEAFLSLSVSLSLSCSPPLCPSPRRVTRGRSNVYNIHTLFSRNLWLIPLYFNWNGAQRRTYTAEVKFVLGVVALNKSEKNALRSCTACVCAKVLCSRATVICNIIKVSGCVVEMLFYFPLLK